MNGVFQRINIMSLSKEMSRREKVWKQTSCQLQKWTFKIFYQSTGEIRFINTVWSKEIARTNKFLLVQFKKFPNPSSKSNWFSSYFGVRIETFICALLFAVLLVIMELCPESFPESSLTPLLVSRPPLSSSRPPPPPEVDEGSDEGWSIKSKSYSKTST